MQCNDIIYLLIIQDTGGDYVFRAGKCLLSRLENEQNGAGKIIFVFLKKLSSP